MRYTVGYQMREDDDFLRAIIDNRENIYEVYFSYGDLPNGRNSQLNIEGLLPHEAMARAERHISMISEAGIGLNLLFNANCYGAEAQSRAFFSKIGEIVEHYATRHTLRSVTTTSPLIAKFIKANFPMLKTRASVNMEIGTREGMDYLAEYFDGYYMKREHNRNFEKIRELSGWCQKNGKELFMLANSGCLNHCSSHIFHDNLVAHEREIAGMDNAYDYRGTCWEYLKNPERRVSFIRDTNYVRPEDMHLYEGYFTAAKLATRVNFSPARVLMAYLAGKYIGTPLEICEPNHAGLLYPYFIDNGRFPKDFAERVGSCDKRCEACGYCDEVLQKTIIKLEESLC